MILSESIDSVRNDLDRPPNEVTLGFEEIKNLLGEWFLLARGLQVGAGIPDLAKQYESLKSEFEILKKNHASELEVLRTNHASQIEALRSEFETVDKEATALRSEREEREQERELDEIDQDILRLLGGEDFPVVSEFIADKIGRPRVLVKHHLDLLLDGEFVVLHPKPPRGGDAPVWELDKKGRAYVATHQLFKTTTRDLTPDEAVEFLVNRGFTVSAGIRGKADLPQADLFQEGDQGESEALRAEIESLKEQLLETQLALENAAFEAGAKAINTQDARLEAIQESILACVRIGGVNKSTDDIAAETGNRLDLVESHLHLLWGKDYVGRQRQVRGTRSVVVWHRTPIGNEYLAANGLLK